MEMETDAFHIFAGLKNFTFLKLTCIIKFFIPVKDRK